MLSVSDIETFGATPTGLTAPDSITTGDGSVFVEYGNVGTKFSYITREGFGWMNASYQVGLRLLPPEMRGPLERLVPPEWLFEVD